MQLICKDIDSADVWESFIEINFPSALFQSWPWGDVQIALGVPVRRLGFYRGNTLIGIAQTVKVTARRGTFLHVRHGPLVLDLTGEVWKFVRTTLVELARKEHCWFIRMSPLLEDTDQNQKLLSSLGARPSPIHAMDAELCWVLSLNKNEDELLADMRKTTRYEIRSAMKQNVTVREGGIEDLPDFFSLYETTSKRHGFVPHRGIAEEFRIFHKLGKAQLLLGVHENKVIAGAIILYYNNQAIYHHGASVSGTVPVSYLIQWKAILEAKKRGMDVYNFWGIAPLDSKNHPWRGISLFKKGFGGREVRYIHSRDITLDPRYLFTYVVESARKMAKGY